MKIIITESQLNKILVEVEDIIGGKKKKRKKNTKEGSKDDYKNTDDIELEEIIVTYDRKTGEVDVKSPEWKYKGEKGRRKRKGSFWVAKGIDTKGMMGKINYFAKKYSEYMVDKIGNHIGPMITSGYRGPSRQINAMWKQWIKDKNYLKSTKEGGVGYNRSLAKPIEKIFIDNEDSPMKAKREAIKFLEEKEKEGLRISNHQVKGAIDLGLFKNNKYNDEILNFLEKAKKEGIISNYIDERDKKGGPHFHVNLV